MITMTFQQAAMLSNGQLFNASEEMVFSGVSTDSRAIQEGMLFVPLVGARVDGHDFARQVMDAKAAGMLWQADHLPIPSDIPVIVVQDPILAMGRLAAGWLQEISPLTIGITGSNGKTSTKDFCANLFALQDKTWKTQGNHNNEIGLPLTIFEADADTKVLILEMGMENAGEIEYLCSIAPLDIAIITSIGSAHLENLGSKQNIARAKCEIVSSLKPGGTFIYHADGPEIQKAIQELPLDSSWHIIPYGYDTDYDPCSLRHTRQGLLFSLPALSSEPFLVPSASQVQALNATAALLAAKAGHVNPLLWHEGLATTKLTPMRGDLHPWKQSILVDDTYKSNPEAVQMALRSFMEIPGSKHIAVLSDMLDLGAEEKALHAQVGHWANELGVDVLFTWGPLSEETSHAFHQTKTHFQNKQDLLSALAPYALEEAVILVKGSRAMKMDEVVQACLKGDF